MEDIMNEQSATMNSTRLKKRRLRLAITLGAALIIAFCASGAWAQGTGGGDGAQDGGYYGPGPDLVTVKEAKTMRDDAPVALQGRLVESLGGEHYLFKDQTDTIKVEIDRKRWAGQNIGPDDLVEIHGEIDKEWSRVEIEVKRIRKL